jgi:polyisoprenyl-phosphate glycosyltransferase
MQPQGPLSTPPATAPTEATAAAPPTARVSLSAAAATAAVAAPTAHAVPLGLVNNTATPRGASARLSCVVPCWNEAQNLERLLPVLTEMLASLSPQWELIVVDDGSTDASVQTVQRWCAQRPTVPQVRLLQLSRNFGKEAALTAGLQAARGDAIILMDGDMQHPPALLPTLLGHWRRGADMVYAVRESRYDESALKRWGANTFYRLVNAADRFELPEGAGDFRLMDRAVVQALLALPERNRFMKGLYAWVGFETVAVPYQPAPRAFGNTTFGMLTLLRFSLDGLTAFTNWPLRAVSLAGVLLALASFVYGGYLTVEYLYYGNPVSGWTTIVVCLLLFSGVQLISLGVVGEYIGRIFEEVKRRPLFVVKSEWGQGLAPAESLNHAAAVPPPQTPNTGSPHR